MTPLTHHQAQELILLGREIPAPDQVALVQHLSICTDCQSFASLTGELHQILPTLYPSSAFSPQEIRTKTTENQPFLRRNAMVTKIFGGIRQSFLYSSAVVLCVAMIFVIFTLLPEQSQSKTGGAGRVSLPLATHLPTETVSPSLTPMLAPAETHVPVDLSQAHVSKETFTDLNGEQWTAEMLYLLHNETGTSESPEEEYHRVTVHGTSGAKWVYDQWTKANTARTSWSNLKWVGESLYWYENVSTMNNPSMDWSTNLRVMNLKTGEVKSIPGFGPDWQSQMVFSPDKDTFAYLDGSVLVVRGLGTNGIGEEIQRIPFEPLDQKSWHAWALVFQSEDNGVVMMQRSPANQMNHVGAVFFDIKKNRAFQQSIPKGYQFYDITTSGKVALRGSDGKDYLLDINNGSIEPVALQPN